VELDITFQQGDVRKPLVIFIHGLGMDANVWADPEKARVLGGKYPLRILLGNTEMKNSFDDLRSLGFSVLTWSQKRPVGEVLSAYAELREIVDAYSSTPKILIGHSRGGLLARMLLTERETPDIRAAITIASPHQGSSVARWVEHISPLAAGLKKLIDAAHNKQYASAVQRVLGFLSGSGLKEMLPGSPFIRSLSQTPASGIRTISIGGTSPSLVVINGKPLSAVLSGILPDSILPEELREGMGDGFVSALSSAWPGADEHRNFPAHHVRLMFDANVREYIIATIKGLS
jgi:pimeloyl-ACP methyl ester carboxylesterase